MLFDERQQYLEAGTHFTFFTHTKVQILTREEVRSPQVQAARV